MNTIFAKFSRDLKNEDVDESDIVEWVGEALGFMELEETLEEAIAFVEVNNHTAVLPTGLKYVIQVVRNHDYNKDPILEQVDNLNLIDNSKGGNPDLQHNPDGSTELNGVVITDSQGNILNTEYSIAYYRPYFDLKYEYQGWKHLTTIKKNLTPVRLSDNTLFNTVVCGEVDYNPSGCQDEYTLIAGNGYFTIRTSFKEGQLIIPYLRAAIDNETGYPLIPDTSSHINAIMYYVKWKLAESYRWSGREGFQNEAADAEQKWLKYIRQSNNKAKMPNGVDEYQNLMMQSLYLIPKYNKYNNFFGGLSKGEQLNYNRRNG